MGSILYCHGFLSSGNCAKSQILSSNLKKYPNISLISPNIEDNIELSYNSIKNLITDIPNFKGVIGSSLGGFWARKIAREFNVPGVLINPVVDIKNMLYTVLGKHTNPYTGNKFEISKELADNLQNFEDPIDIIDKRLLHIYLGTEDEVLDYRKAESWFKDCDIHILQGENHGLKNFDLICNEVISFFQFS